IEDVDEEVADDLFDGHAGGDRGDGRVRDRIGLGALAHVEQFRPPPPDEPEVAHCRPPWSFPRSECIGGVRRAEAYRMRGGALSTGVAHPVFLDLTCFSLWESQRFKKRS